MIMPMPFKFSVEKTLAPQKMMTKNLDEIQKNQK